MSSKFDQAFEEYRQALRLSEGEAWSRLVTAPPSDREVGELRRLLSEATEQEGRDRRLAAYGDGIALNEAAALTANPPSGRSRWAMEQRLAAIQARIRDDARAWAVGRGLPESGVILAFLTQHPGRARQLSEATTAIEEARS